MNSDGHAIVKTFSLVEFRDLFRAAVDRCRAAAEAKHCDGPLPIGELFYLGGLDQRFEFLDAENIIRIPRATLLSFDEAIPFLLREDGFHRPDIRVSPFGVRSDAAIFEVEWDGDWTDRVIRGELAFPLEPFIIMGPALPVGAVPGITKVRLPTIDILC